MRFLTNEINSTVCSNGIEVEHRHHIVKYARKAATHFHHFVFLTICLQYNVTPKGLKLKKEACIADVSASFLQEWEGVKQRGEAEFVRLLKRENWEKARSYKLKFWDAVVKRMEAGNMNEVKELFIEILAELNMVEVVCRERRKRKINSRNE